MDSLLSRCRFVNRKVTRRDLQPDTHDITTNFLNVFWGMKPEEEPVRPEAAAMVNHRRQNPQESPFTQCLPGGIPATLLVNTFKIVQTPQEIVMLPETLNPPRQIFLDGRPLPKDPDPRWMGYSVGRWEGDALVVDSSGFREGGWLDRMGHPHSSDLHLIERFRRLDVGHLEIDVTIDDPKAYGKRFTYTLRQTLIPDQDLYEYFCTE